MKNKNRVKRPPAPGGKHPTRRESSGNVTGLFASRLDQILNSQSEHVVCQDVTHRIIWANKAAADSVGLDPEQLVGSYCYEALRGAHQPHLDCPLEKALQTGQAHTSEITFPDGRVWLVHGDPVRDAAGNIVGLIETATEITERKRAEDRLQKSQEKYSNLVERSNDGIVVVQDGCIAFANTRMIEMTGFSLEEVLVKPPFLAFVAPDYRALVADRYKRRMAGEAVPDRYEAEILSKKGEKIPIEINASLIEHEGKPAFLAIVRDITERKRAETALRASEQNFRNSLDGSPLGIRIVSADVETLYTNQALLDIYGYSSVDELKATPVSQRYTPESYMAHVERRDKRKRGEPVPDNYEISIIRKDGKIRHLEVFRKEVLWNGKPQFQVLYNDITERKQAEEALRESEERFRATFHQAAVGIAHVGRDGRWLRMNQKLCDIVGYTRDELLGMTFQDITHPDDLNTDLEFVRQMLAGEIQTYSMEKRYFRKDGSLVWINLTVSLVRETSGEPNYFISVVEDITERKRSTEKLLDSLKATIEAMALTVEMRDPYTAGHQRRVTKLACVIVSEMGLSEDRIEGLRMAGIVHDIGKIYVPAEILSKPGRLNEIEFSLIKMHCQAGFDILKTIEFPWPIAQIVLQHHERTDGSGYPQGVSGEDILLEARILAVSDVVEAMSSHRPYRPALGLDKGLEEIAQGRGVRYDSNAVDACLRLFNEKGFKLE